MPASSDEYVIGIPRKYPTVQSVIDPEIVDQPVIGLQRAPLTLQYVVLSAVVITEPHKPRPLEFPE